LYYDQNSSSENLSDSLKTWNIEESYYSEWLNASSVNLTDSTFRLLRVKLSDLKLQKAGNLTQNATKITPAETLSYALDQIRGEYIRMLGLTGKGVKIGIIDGGFLNAPNYDNLGHFFKNKLVANYKDFITPDLAPYNGDSKLDDQHGTEVWEMLGGYSNEKKITYGLATGATYFLARTDHGAGEKRIEEEYFIEALEWMYKQGVRLINTSLGYTNGYDNDAENYTPNQMNGSSAIARATQIAIEEKGMIVVGAAGNEGDLAWKVINTPADARDVIAVGASKNTLLDKMDYSSIGPEFLDYIKPDLTCFSATGTSFAAPVITGLIACMLEYNPDLTQEEIRFTLIKSCSLYPYGNNYLGYGNPNAQKIARILVEGSEVSSDVIKVIVPPRKNFFSKLFKNQQIASHKYKIRPGDNSVVIFHKYDQWKVIQRKIIIPDKKKMAVTPTEKTTQTTVIVGNKIFELIWE